MSWIAWGVLYGCVVLFVIFLEIDFDYDYINHNFQIDIFAVRKHFYRVKQSQ